MRQPIDIRSWIGKPVEVVFLDHVSGEDATETLLCRVWGKLLSVAFRTIVIQQWEAADNFDNIALVRSAIKTVTLLQSGEVKYAP